MGKRWLSHVTGVFVLVESTERSAGLRAGVDEEPKVKLLMTIPNVSVIVAAVFVSVSDEAGRFRNAHQVGAYLGLVPSEKSSGDRRRLGAITKQGNSYARAMLMQASWGLMRSARQSDPRQQWAAAVARRRGEFVAAVALARRLAGIMWVMWHRTTPGPMSANSRLTTARFQYAA